MSESIQIINEEQRRLAELGLPLSDEVDVSTVKVIFGATILVMEDAGGQTKVTLLDPNQEVDQTLIAGLPGLIAPQPPHQSAVTRFMEGYTGEHIDISVGEESEEEMLARLRGTPTSPEEHMGRILLNGKRISQGTAISNVVHLARRCLPLVRVR